MRMIGWIHTHPGQPFCDREFVTSERAEGTVTGTTRRHSDGTQTPGQPTYTGAETRSESEPKVEYSHANRSNVGAQRG